MRFYSFGSGSSGNAFLLESDDARLLFDCGIGIRRLRRALIDLDAAGKLDAIIISHEHSDHVRALHSLLRYERCPVYASDGTFRAIGMKSNWSALASGDPTPIGDVEITAVPVLHDASEPFGFHITAGSEQIALFTDLGEPTSDVNDAIGEASIVVLESNYCESMLRRSDYPATLKRRIRSHLGHLSNDDCGATLAGSLTPKAHTVWLAHLSEHNNLPLTAETAVETALNERGIGLQVRSLPRHDTANLLDPVATERSWQVSLL